jgi:cysteine-rich repeat protein
MENKMKKIYSGMLFLALTLSLIGFTSALVDSSSLFYSDSTQYSPSSHLYDIPDTNVGYVIVDLKGTSNGDSVCLTFNYNDGTSAITPCQSVLYLSWTSNTFSNPNPSLSVASILVKGGTHTYMRNLFVYSNGDGLNPGSGTNPTNTNSSCGNNITNSGEECDVGLSNGILCSAGYGSSCTYCSNQCKIKTVVGEYCGDGRVNPTYERCDDGNRINNDRCSNECKKPFEVVVEDFAPLVWQCDNSRVVYDDSTGPGRVSDDGQTLVERINDYAFEGEQIQWKVLVMDKNGIEKVRDVYATVNENKEANCMLLHDNNQYPKSEVTNEAVVSTDGNGIDPSCNPRIDEEQITEFNPETMAYYLCTLTIETPDSMQGQSDVNVEVEDIDGQIGQMAEKEKWFLNPLVELRIDGFISFDDVRPGTSSYSGLVTVTNGAEYDSGVILDMFISGTDFYDESSSGAKCGISNQLELRNFAYHATNGAYSSSNDLQVGRTCDAEGYCQINYGIGFNDPHPFYNANEILQSQKVGPYYAANILSPGSKVGLTFRLNLPEPCNGDFDNGQIYFWGEAI